MPLTNTDTDFWWLRYFCGLALSLAVAILAGYSLISLHSYAPFDGRHRGIHFVSVEGTLAQAMGIMYLGIALMLFGSCYAQYQEKMAYYYQWIVLPGALMMISGIIWFFWIHLAG